MSGGVGTEPQLGVPLPGVDGGELLLPDALCPLGTIKIGDDACVALVAPHVILTVPHYRGQRPERKKAADNRKLGKYIEKKHNADLRIYFLDLFLNEISREAPNDKELRQKSFQNIRPTVCPSTRHRHSEFIRIATLSAVEVCQTGFTSSTDSFHLQMSTNRCLSPPLA